MSHITVVTTGFERHRTGCIPPILRGLQRAKRTASGRFPLEARERTTLFGPKHHVQAGGLMSYSPDRADLWRRGAIFVDKILKGARPADLPVQQPTKFELAINLKTARAIGVTIPPSFILRADEVIE
jgi:ABC transporter substrate binding protein